MVICTKRVLRQQRWLLSYRMVSTQGHDFVHVEGTLMRDCRPISFLIHPKSLGNGQKILQAWRRIRQKKSRLIVHFDRFLTKVLNN
jgi:hypothetical protein